jgi:folate-binding protein YgfZ
MLTNWHILLQQLGVNSAQENFDFSRELSKDLALAKAQACLIPLPQLGTIAITGPDAAKFLQGQVSCDVNEVSASTSRLGVHCNPKGRVVFSFHLFRQQETLYFSLPMDMVTIGLTALDKYARFSKVSLSDVSQEFFALGFIGPDIEQTLKHYFTSVPQESDSIVYQNDLQLCRLPGPEPRFIARGEAAAISKVLQTLVHVCPVLNPKSWELSEIRAGVAHVYPTSCERFTPHQLNYQLVKGISFTKGCYTGQEVVARMQYLGKLKQHMYRVCGTGNSLPQAGEPVAMWHNDNWQPVGEVVMSALSEQGYEALVSMQDMAIGHKLCIKDYSELVLAELPYPIHPK